MIQVITETRTVYRSSVGRKTRLRKRTAYLDAAWQAWRAKYPCTCERETRFVCIEHDTALSNEREEEPARWAYRRRAIARLARWLMWRDQRIAALSVASAP